MSSNKKPTVFTTERVNSTLREFLHSEASGGLLLMAVAAVGLAVANSPRTDLLFGDEELRWCTQRPALGQ